MACGNPAAQAASAGMATAVLHSGRWIKQEHKDCGVALIPHPAIKPASADIMPSTTTLPVRILA